MVERGEHGDARELCGVDVLECARPRPHGREVVQARGRQELAVRSEHGRFLHGEREDIESVDVGEVDSGGFREEAQHVRACRVRIAEAPGLHHVGQTDHRLGVPLPVECEAFVGLPVQVDRELGDACDRARLREDGRAVAQHQTSSEAELAVEP